MVKPLENQSEEYESQEKNRQVSRALTQPKTHHMRSLTLEKAQRQRNYPDPIFPCLQTDALRSKRNLLQKYLILSKSF